MENVDLHLTLLFGWLVRTVGLALMWSIVVLFVIVGAALLIDEPGLAWVAVAVGPVVFAWALMGAQAPMPSGVDKEL